MGDNVLVPDGVTNFFQINDIYYPKIIGLGSDIKTITGATYNVQKFDSTLLVNGLVTGTVITIAFPTDEYVFENAEYYTHQNLKNRTIGKQFTFVKTDANANNITITSTGKTINGAVNYIMAIQDDAVTIQYDGANWVVINDSVYVSGGGGGGFSTLSANTTSVFLSEENSIVTTISSALITLANFKTFTVIPTETTETSLDDFTLNGVSFNIENIIDAVSFDIRSSSVNNATGTYSYKYIITYS